MGKEMYIPCPVLAIAQSSSHQLNISYIMRTCASVYRIGAAAKQRRF